MIHLEGQFHIEMLVFIILASHRFHFLFGEVAHTLAQGFLFGCQVEIHVLFKI